MRKKGCLCVTEEEEEGRVGMQIKQGCGEGIEEGVQIHITYIEENRQGRGYIHMHAD